MKLLQYFSRCYHILFTQSPFHCESWWIDSLIYTNLVFTHFNLLFQIANYKLIIAYLLTLHSRLRCDLESEVCELELWVPDWTAALIDTHFQIYSSIRFFPFFSRAITSGNWIVLSDLPICLFEPDTYENLATCCLYSLWCLISASMYINNAQGAGSNMISRLLVWSLLESAITYRV